MLRLLRSRGAAKFRRNRLAMTSLAVIGAYVALTAFIVVTNAVENVGRRSGAFTLEGRPISGFLLTSQTREIFGPREIPGFGVRGGARLRLERQLFFADLAGNAFRDVDRLGPGSERDPRLVLDDYAIAGRPFADLPVEELRGIYELVRSASADAIELRRYRTTLEGLPRMASEAAAHRAAFERALEAGSDDLADRQEDLAFALEDIAGAIGEYKRAGLGESAMSAFDQTPLVEAAEALLDADDPAGVELYDPAVLASAVEAASSAASRLDEQLIAEIDTVEPLIERLFPEPTGLEGVVHALRLSLGTDRQGRSILIRALYSAKIAIQVGVVTALVAVALGSVLGAAAAFFGGLVDHGVNWLVSMFTSIPYLVLMAVLAMLFLGTPVEGTLIPLYAAFALTYWIGPCRVIRGESMKIKELEYVQAATAIGFGRWYILLRHILPNTSHLMFINFSLLLIAAIKGEVILTFLGLGLKDGASWGIMIRDSAQQVVNDNFWQMGSATFFMFTLVLAFNVFTDALQDAFDPKHVA